MDPYVPKLRLLKSIAVSMGWWVERFRPSGKRHGCQNLAYHLLLLVMMPLSLSCGALIKPKTYSNATGGYIS